jgi:hypothetical protein
MSINKELADLFREASKTQNALTKTISAMEQLVAKIGQTTPTIESTRPEAKNDSSMAEYLKMIHNSLAHLPQTMDELRKSIRKLYETESGQKKEGFEPYREEKKQEKTEEPSEEKDKNRKWKRVTRSFFDMYPNLEEKYGKKAKQFGRLSKSVKKWWKEKDPEQREKAWKQVKKRYFDMRPDHKRLAEAPRRVKKFVSNLGDYFGWTKQQPEMVVPSQPMSPPATVGGQKWAVDPTTQQPNLTTTTLGPSSPSSPNLPTCSNSESSGNETVSQKSENDFELKADPTWQSMAKERFHFYLNRKSLSFDELKKHRIGHLLPDLHSKYTSDDQQEAHRKFKEGKDEWANIEENKQWLKTQNPSAYSKYFGEKVLPSAPADVSTSLEKATSPNQGGNDSPKTSLESSTLARLPISTISSGEQNTVDAVTSSDWEDPFSSNNLPLAGSASAFKSGKVDPSMGVSGEGKSGENDVLSGGQAIVTTLKDILKLVQDIKELMEKQPSGTPGSGDSESSGAKNEGGVLQSSIKDMFAGKDGGTVAAAGKNVELGAAAGEGFVAAVPFLPS